jgi:hypothetical protein
MDAPTLLCIDDRPQLLELAKRLSNLKVIASR